MGHWLKQQRVFMNAGKTKGMYAHFHSSYNDGFRTRITAEIMPNATVNRSSLFYFAKYHVTNK
jgi:hypothetical protein